MRQQANGDGKDHEQVSQHEHLPTVSRMILNRGAMRRQVIAELRNCGIAELQAILGGGSVCILGNW
jgi:hypothetical protein